MRLNIIYDKPWTGPCQDSSYLATDTGVAVALKKGFFQLLTAPYLNFLFRNSGRIFYAYPAQFRLPIKHVRVGGTLSRIFAAGLALTCDQPLFRLRNFAHADQTNH